MSRLLSVIGVGVLLLLQPATALATSSPSPALDGLLAPPPEATFVELPATTPGVFAGAFDAAAFVKIDGTPDPTNDQKTMENDGFLSGFGKTWIQQKASHALIEAVLAFKGGLGANQWMHQLQTADKKQPSYKSAVTVDGISNYYGEHLYDSTNNLYSDVFVIVKGNDAFLVAAASPKDDLGTLGATQAKKQFDVAPDLTIPKSEWPESKVLQAASSVVMFAGIGIGVIVLIGLVAVVLVMRRRRPMAQAVPAAYGGPAGVQPAAVAAVPVQMSEDRRSWWDGTAWRDAEHEAPPAAQRSDDGKFWWDGQTWRPMPGGPTT